MQWIDHRMPRIPKQVENNVFYLYRTDPKTGEVTGPWGTGFVVVRPYGPPDLLMGHYYAVSNHHVAVDGGASLIRINTAKGSRLIDTDPLDWTFFGQGDDLCVTDITDQLDPDDDISAVKEDTFASRKLIDDYEIRFGEDAFMVGLFVDHGGSKRNAPSTRFGNVSRLASESDLVKQPNGNLRPSHLVDLRSRPGFSGSPVFVFRTHASDLSTEFTDAMKGAARGSYILFTEKEHFLKLLGVHCGQFRDVIKIKEARNLEVGEALEAIEEGVENANVALKIGDKLYIPSSMTIVVPAWCITDLLNHPELEAMRKKREAGHNDTSIPEPESA